jgi:hypothetical protein
VTATLAPCAISCGGRKREIDADLKTQQQGIEVAIHPNFPDLYRKKVAKLHQALQHEATRSQVVETIRSLVDRIEVSPDLERGRCGVTIVGGLARILAFANEKKTAIGDGGTFLMVAGARNNHNHRLPSFVVTIRSK